MGANDSPFLLQFSLLSTGRKGTNLRPLGDEGMLLYIDVFVLVPVCDCGGVQLG